MAEARRAATQEANARWRYGRTTAGQAEMAYERGDEFFSIDLDVDGDLAEHLNAIHNAGWRRDSLSRIRRNSTHVGQTQTFIFRRDA